MTDKLRLFVWKMRFLLILFSYFFIFVFYNAMNYDFKLIKGIHSSMRGEQQK